MVLVFHSNMQRNIGCQPETDIQNQVQEVKSSFKKSGLYYETNQILFWQVGIYWPLNYQRDDLLCTCCLFINRLCKIISYYYKIQSTHRNSNQR